MHMDLLLIAYRYFPDSCRRDNLHNTCAFNSSSALLSLSQLECFVSGFDLCSPATRTSKPPNTSLECISAAGNGHACTKMLKFPVAVCSCAEVGLISRPETSQPTPLSLVLECSCTYNNTVTMHSGQPDSSAFTVQVQCNDIEGSSRLLTTNEYPKENIRFPARITAPPRNFMISSLRQKVNDFHPTHELFPKYTTNFMQKRNTGAQHDLLLSLAAVSSAWRSLGVIMHCCNFFPLSGTHKLLRDGFVVNIIPHDPVDNTCSQEANT